MLILDRLLFFGMFVIFEIDRRVVLILPSFI
jgi:hypothetical protein